MNVESREIQKRWSLTFTHEGQNQTLPSRHLKRRKKHWWQTQDEGRNIEKEFYRQKIETELLLKKNVQKIVCFLFQNFHKEETPSPHGTEETKMRSNIIINSLTTGCIQKRPGVNQSCWGNLRLTKSLQVSSPEKEFSYVWFIEKLTSLHQRWVS